MQNKRAILSDHKRVGKRFIPPFLQLTNMLDVPWADHGLPEFVWIGLLHQEHGLKRGTDLALSLARAAMATICQPPLPLFACISSYSDFDNDQQEQVMARLRQERKLGLIRRGLVPLIRSYPACPLRWLSGQEPLPSKSEGTDINRLSLVVEDLLDRRSYEATMVQVNALYIGIITGKIKVFKGAGFDEIEPVVAYPLTELSRKIAASTRACVSLMTSTEVPAEAYTWRSYFWNRGLDLAPCSPVRGENE